jgi:hypothetical protein
VLLTVEPLCTYVADFKFSFSFPFFGNGAEGWLKRRAAKKKREEIGAEPTHYSSEKVHEYAKEKTHIHIYTYVYIHEICQRTTGTEDEGNEGKKKTQRTEVRIYRHNLTKMTQKGARMTFAWEKRRPQRVLDGSL